MRVVALCREALVCFLVCLLFAGSFCYGDDDKENVVEVVGAGECSDCAQNNINTSHAFSGMQLLWYIQALRAFCPLMKPRHHLV